MKRLAIILLGIFALTLFPILPAEASGDGNKGTVKRDRKGAFEQIEWQIISRGGSGTRYRVIERQITIDGHTASFSPTKITPKPGETIMQTVTIDAAELASGMGVSPQDVEGWMNTGAVAQVSVTIQIIDGNDNVLGTYTDCESLRTAMKNKGFPQTDIDYVGSFWGIADDPDRPSKTSETPETPSEISVDLEAVDIKILDGNNNIVEFLTVGEIYTVKATYRNNANLDCRNANLRTYIANKDNPFNPLASSDSQNIAAYQSIIRTNRKFTAAQGQNVITISINKRMEGSSWVDERFITSDGKIKEESDTTNNIASLTMVALMDGNLAAASLCLLDSDGNVVKNPEPGHAYYPEAKFVSTFDYSGEANLRVYKKMSDSLHYTLVDSKKRTFSPFEQYTHKFDSVTFGSGAYEVVATINLKYDNGKWIEEEFKGKKEEDYSDNIIGLNQTLSDNPVLFGPKEFESDLWFPPIIKHEAKVITKTKIVEEDVIGWKKIKVNPPKKPKIIIRLAPSESD